MKDHQVGAPIQPRTQSDEEDFDAAQVHPDTETDDGATRPAKLHQREIVERMVHLCTSQQRPDLEHYTCAGGDGDGVENGLHRFGHTAHQVAAHGVSDGVYHS